MNVGTLVSVRLVPEQSCVLYFYLIKVYTG